MAGAKMGWPLLLGTMVACSGSETPTEGRTAAQLPGRCETRAAIEAEAGVDAILAELGDVDGDGTSEILALDPLVQDAPVWNVWLSGQGCPDENLAWSGVITASATPVGDELRPQVTPLQLSTGVGGVQSLLAVLEAPCIDVENAGSVGVYAFLPQEDSDAAVYQLIGEPMDIPCTTVPAVHEVIVAPSGAGRFEPAELTIRPGDTVLWRWEGNRHTVTSGVPGQPDELFCSNRTEASGCRGNVTHNSGHTFSFTFEEAGSFPYYCRPHANLGMTGTVVVEAP